MKIFHIVPDISSEANGVTPVIDGLSSSSIQCGDQVAVCALGAKLTDPRVQFFEARRSPLLRLNEYSADFSKYLKIAFREFDIVHGHGLWSSANILTGIYAGTGGARLVISPHGMLTEWAMSRRRVLKRLLWPFQQLAFERACLFHATAESEVEDIRRVGYQGPIALIPNGIHMPYLSSVGCAYKKKRILFLSRLHPKKGLENLLHAWSKVSCSNIEWELVIAGVGSPEYEAQLKDLSNSLGLQRIKWFGPAYGGDKELLYRESSLFILPSFSENFGMVVAEAMSYGLPCIVSKGAPWSSLIDERAGWWVDNGVEALVSTLQQAFSLQSDELLLMGSRGRAYVEKNFSMDTVGREFYQSYRWLVNNGKRPEFIQG